MPTRGLNKQLSLAQVNQQHIYQRKRRFDIFCSPVEPTIHITWFIHWVLRKWLYTSYYYCICHKEMTSQLCKYDRFPFPLNSVSDHFNLMYKGQRAHLLGRHRGLQMSFRQIAGVKRELKRKAYQTHNTKTRPDMSDSQSLCQPQMIIY